MKYNCVEEEREREKWDIIFIQIQINVWETMKNGISKQHNYKDDIYSE